jgi:hypothetical protein
MHEYSSKKKAIMHGLNKLKPRGTVSWAQSWNSMRPRLQMQKKGVASVVRSNVWWADMEANASGKSFW